MVIGSMSGGTSLISTVGGAKGPRGAKECSPGAKRHSARRPRVVGFQRVTEPRRGDSTLTMVPAREVPNVEERCRPSGACEWLWAGDPGSPLRFAPGLHAFASPRLGFATTGFPDQCGGIATVRQRSARRSLRRRNFPDQYGGIATLTNLLQAFPRRPCRNFPDLISTVGLRLFLKIKLARSIDDSRNFPDQYGGIATFRNLQALDTNTLNLSELP